MKVEEIKLAFETNVKFANADTVYQKMFNAQKTALNTGASSIVSQIGKSDSEYQSAKQEAQTALSELQKLDPSLADTKYGMFLKTSIQMADDNIAKLRQAQGSVNNAIKLLNSLQNKNKL